MQTRRNFIGNVATGLAGSIATGRALGANDRIRLGIIGVGERGTQTGARGCRLPEHGIGGVCGRLYAASGRFGEAGARQPRRYLDYRQLLEDKSVDAVLIATPQHLHAECFLAALDAGKHVYQEKTMAFTVGASHGRCGRRLRARRQADGADRAPGAVRPGRWRMRRIIWRAACGQGHGDSRAHVPQYSARKAAVDAAGLSRYECRDDCVEGVSGERSGA